MITLRKHSLKLLRDRVVNCTSVNVWKGKLPPIEASIDPNTSTENDISTQHPTTVCVRVQKPPRRLLHQVCYNEDQLIISYQQRGI